MNPGKHHQMELVRTHASGAEEWLCSECGRRFLMQWPPHYKKIVLDPGDEMATHSGGRGGVQQGGIGFAPADEVLPPIEEQAEPHSADADDDDVPLDDEKLRPWRELLEGPRFTDAA